MVEWLLSYDTVVIVTLGLTAFHCVFAGMSAKTYYTCICIAVLSLGYLYYAVEFGWIGITGGVVGALGAAAGFYLGVKVRYPNPHRSWETFDDAIVFAWVCYVALAVFHPVLVFESWPKRAYQVEGSVTSPAMVWVTTIGCLIPGIVLCKWSPMKWLVPIGFGIAMSLFVPSGAFGPLMLVFLIGWLSASTDALLGELLGNGLYLVVLVCLAISVLYMVYLKEGSGATAMALEVTPLYMLCGTLLRALVQHRVVRAVPSPIQA